MIFLLIYKKIASLARSVFQTPVLVCVSGRVSVLQTSPHPVIKIPSSRRVCLSGCRFLKVVLPVLYVASSRRQSWCVYPGVSQSSRLRRTRLLRYRLPDAGIELLCLCASCIPRLLRSFLPDGFSLLHLRVIFRVIVDFPSGRRYIRNRVWWKA